MLSLKLAVKVSRGTLDKGKKNTREKSNKNSTWRHGEVNPLQMGEGSHSATGQKIKVHSNPEVMYGVLDFRARVCPALMNCIDSIFSEIALRCTASGESRAEKFHATTRIS